MKRVIKALKYQIDRTMHQPIITIGKPGHFVQDKFERQLDSLAPHQKQALVELKAAELPVGLAFSNKNLVNHNLGEHKKVLRLHLHQVRQNLIKRYPEFKPFLEEAHHFINQSDEASTQVALKVEQSAYRVLGKAVLQRLQQAPYQINGQPTAAYHQPLMQAMTHRINNKMGI